MMNRRFLGVGFLCLLVGGCNSQPQAGNSSLENKTAAPQPMASPKWEAGAPPVQADQAYGASPEQVLARRAAAYANSVNGGNGYQGDGTGGAASLHIDVPAPVVRQQHRKMDDSPAAAGNATPAAPVDASWKANPPVMPPTGGAAQVAGASLSAGPGLSGDEPKIVPESADWASAGPGGDALVKRLLKRARENPRDISNQLDLQLYGMLNDDQAPELASMSLMPNEDRELVSALVDGLSNFRANVRQDANMLPAQKIKPLMEMVQRLQSQADLTVSTVALCRRVDAFGKYDPIVPARFPAMKENWVIVYCEVEHFLPKQNARQMWETNLSEQVTLYTDTGLLVWSDNKQKVTDECRNRRHDFFAFNKIALPATLGVGRYVLKVSIEDENADRVAEASVPVSIAAQ